MENKNTPASEQTAEGTEQTLETPETPNQTPVTSEPRVYPLHRVANLFPRLGEEELKQLAEDIAQRGQLEPAWLYEGQIIDGANRQLACQMLKRDLITENYTGDDPIGFAVARNMRRRQLSQGQLAAIAVEVEKLLAEEARKRKAHGQTAPGRTLRADRPTASKGRARDQAAQMTGASGRGVQRAKRVAKSAPELLDQVRAGDMTLNSAEESARKREVQQRRAPARLPQVRLGKFREVFADLKDVDAVITDVSTRPECLGLLEELAAGADAVLKPEGLLAVKVDQSYLPQALAGLSGHRPYRWTLCLLTRGQGRSDTARSVTSRWHPVLLFGGGAALADVIQATAGPAVDEYFDTGAEALVVGLTQPKQCIVDPLCGHGATVVAAWLSDRRVFACDIAEEKVATTKRRLHRVNETNKAHGAA